MIADACVESTVAADVTVLCFDDRPAKTALASAILRGDVKDGDAVAVRVGAAGLEIAPARAAAPEKKRKAG